jgi:hypothetical protein
LNTGLRFSRNALPPSAKSLLSLVSSWSRSMAGMIVATKRAA